MFFKQTLFRKENIIMLGILAKMRKKNPTIAKNLRRVELHWEHGEKPTVHIVSEQELQRLIKATVKLHHHPGVNPHVKDRDAKTAQVAKIIVQRLVSSGPYWWSTPNLQENGDPNGATLWDWSIVTETVWEKPQIPVSSNA